MPFIIKICFATVQGDAWRLLLFLKSSTYHILVVVPRFGPIRIWVGVWTTWATLVVTLLRFIIFLILRRRSKQICVKAPEQLKRRKKNTYYESFHCTIGVIPHNLSQPTQWVIELNTLKSCPIAQIRWMTRQLFESSVHWLDKHFESVFTDWMIESDSLDLEFTDKRTTVWIKFIVFTD
jgi:hypothetical protein